MTAFAHSSALVKLYAAEAGGEEVRALDAIAISALARVEVPAAIWRKHRIGELARDDAVVLSGEFEADYFGDGLEGPRFGILEAGPEVLERAAQLLPAHGLRAYDAVQLATGLAARDADPSCSEFACADGELRAAASDVGFELVPSD